MRVQLLTPILSPSIIVRPALPGLDAFLRPLEEQLDPSEEIEKEYRLDSDPVTHKIAVFLRGAGEGGQQAHRIRMFVTLGIHLEGLPIDLPDAAQFDEGSGYRRIVPGD